MHEISHIHNSDICCPKVIVYSIVIPPFNYKLTFQICRCIELWNYALDMQQSMLECLNPMTQSSLFSFTELFSFMMGEEGKHTSRGRLVPPVDVLEILRVFKKAIKEVDVGNQTLNRLPSQEKDMTYLTRVCTYVFLIKYDNN